MIEELSNCDAESIASFIFLGLLQIGFEKVRAIPFVNGGLSEPCGEYLGISLVSFVRTGKRIEIHDGLRKMDVLEGERCICRRRNLFAMMFALDEDRCLEVPTHHFWAISRLPRFQP